MKSIFVIFSILFALNSNSLAGQESIDQYLNDYKKSCGGEIYSKCDNENKNQYNLFKLAVDEALKDNKFLYLEFGFDDCPSCRMLARSFAENTDLLKKLKEQVVVLKIDGRMNSTNAILKDIKVNINSFPRSVLFDPKTLNTVKSIAEYKYSQNIIELVDIVLSEIQKYSVVGMGKSSSNENDKINISEEDKLLDMLVKSNLDKNNEDTYVGDVRIKTLQNYLPIESGYGFTLYSPSSSSEIKNSEKLQEYKDQLKMALLYIHNFNWVRAARAALSALQINNKSIQAYAFLGYALEEIEFTSQLAKASILKAYSLSKSSVGAELSREESVAINFLIKKVCSSFDDVCGFRELIGQSSITIIKQVLTPENLRILGPDFISLLAYHSSDLQLMEETLTKLKNRNEEITSVHHYAMHLYESIGDIQTAAIHGKLFAQEAPKSPHAQHMYGHLLPQLGNWTEGIAQFKVADKLHAEDFLRGNVTANEDWHYAHNIDLLVAALVYTGQMDEALNYSTSECNVSYNCSKKEMVQIIMGLIHEDPYLIKEKNENWAKALTHPYYIYLRGMFNFALGNYEIAEAALSKLEELKEDKADYSFYLKKAIEIVNQPEKVDAILGEISEQAKKYGFESWSGNAINLKMLQVGLKRLNKQDLAKKVQELKIEIKSQTKCTTCKS